MLARNARYRPASGRGHGLYLSARQVLRAASVPDIAPS